MRFHCHRATLVHRVLLACVSLSWALAASVAAGPDPAGRPVESRACGVENLLAGRRPIASQEIRGEVALLTDGAVGAEGTAWDGPPAIKIETGAGFVTYDLGQPRSISALVLQADANDTYRISGAPASAGAAASGFKLLAEIPNVVARGAGLRTRAVEIPPTTVRYLRVGEANGDGFYSISELGAYCARPTPFPPTLRVLEGPAAAAPATDAPPAGAPVRQSRGESGSVLVLAAAAAALAWLAYKTVRR
jgi:hypothetical protein